MTAEALTNVEDIQKLVDAARGEERKARRRALMLTIIPIVAAAAWLLATFGVVRRLESRAAQLRSESHSLEKANAALLIEKQKLSADNQRLAALARLLNGPLPSVIQPKLYAQRVEEITDPHGNPVYDFILFLSVPEPRRGEIRSVEYIVNHPEKLNKVMRGGSSEASFAAAYRGTGCFIPVLIRVTPTNGAPFVISFDECAAWRTLGDARPPA